MSAEIEPEGQGAEVPEPETPRQPAPPISSRFLFVDVAAQRAKQLRRGALPRLTRDAQRDLPRKFERLAMEEVRHGLIDYSVPDSFGPHRTEGL